MKKVAGWKRKFAWLPTDTADGRVVFKGYYQRVKKVTPTAQNNFIEKKVENKLYPR